MEFEPYSTAQGSAFAGEFEEDVRESSPPLPGPVARVEYTDPEGQPVAVLLGSFRPRVTIGRGPTNDISTTSVCVSRNHAQITLRAGYFLLEDVRSSGGTLLNGVEIGQRKMVLRDGDTIHCSDFLLVFCDEEPGTVDDPQATPPAHPDWPAEEFAAEATRAGVRIPLIAEEQAAEATLPPELAVTPAFPSPVAEVSEPEDLGQLLQEQSTLIFQVIQRMEELTGELAALQEQLREVQGRHAALAVRLQA